MEDEYFSIRGKKILRGEIEVSGAKNSATPAIAATLLTDKPCLIKNIPKIEDIFCLLELVKGLGGKIEIGRREVRIQAKNLDPQKINAKLVTKLRSSVLLLAPLLSRFHFARIPEPGGCLIGTRPLDAHLEAMEAFGAKVYKENPSLFIFEGKNLKPGEVILPEFSVTATENALMMASSLEGRSVIKIAALEPHVQDLVSIFKKMGAQISFGGPHEILVEGKKRLRGFEHSIIHDPVEAGTYLILSGVVRSKIRVKNAKKEHLNLVLKKLKDFGMKFEFEKDGILVDGRVKLQAVGKIQMLPYPGIPTDLQCNFGVLATQAEGMTLIHDPLYEGRLKYLEELNQMGAKIIFCDPHRALIFGKTKLYGKNLRTYDLRGGVALILAALSAKGESTIDNVCQIDRGYEKIEEKLQKLGAEIKRVKH